MVDFVSIGIVLVRARTARKISQENVAELTKVSVDTIRNIEHGYTIPHMETIFALWDIYELPKLDIWKYYFRDKSVNKLLKELGINSVNAPDKELFKV